MLGNLTGNTKGEARHWAMAGVVKSPGAKAPNGNLSGGQVSRSQASGDEEIFAPQGQLQGLGSKWGR